jgi:rhamnogalacturonan acetylesterase
MSKPLTVAALALSLSLALLARAQTAPASAPAPAPAALPTLWIIGDSTINNTAGGALGWGAPVAIGKLFDPAKITVQNRARGGRSARSFYSEGLWDAVKNALQPGDYVLMQFGTNDGGKVQTSTNGRPDLPGIGDETTTGTASTGGKQETVHTFGWYMDAYVKDTQAKKATPIMLNPVPHNRWDTSSSPSKIRRGEVTSFDKWSSDVALKENAPYIDLCEISSSRLDKEGQQVASPKYFMSDGTHSTPAGALLNAESVVMGIRALKDLKLNDYLSDAGKKLDPAPDKLVRAPKPATTTAPAN